MDEIDFVRRILLNPQGHIDDLVGLEVLERADPLSPWYRLAVKKSSKSESEVLAAKDLAVSLKEIFDEGLKALKRAVTLVGRE